MNEESLFAEALCRPAEERAGFLEQACAGRPEIRVGVEALLAAHEKSDNLLDRPADTVASGPTRAHSDATHDHSADSDDGAHKVEETADYQSNSEAGIIIGGRYTLLEKIGEGGMGDVWVAKQTEPVKRRVALKLIKKGMDSKAVLARFEQERQALAMMDHPNISKVLDGGLTPTGQPFFVMELVNGLSLTRFCDEARLTFRERLELFVPICQAVQHAHQKGIVHRDLKPANILVTIIDGKAIPKVIDFGVAKATAGKLTDQSMSTQFGAVIGTLEYMSPEQTGFSGVDIDTRSDIYSLGVILYELLTGLRPIDPKQLKQAAIVEMIRIIQEDEPSKPSTRLSTNGSLPSLAALRQTEPRRLVSLLRGELDWVVMKCLEKHRERRYETANALARDIQRHLADEAVEARPPSAGYRFSKFIHRNRGPVVAASLVLLTLIVGIVGTTYGMIRADESRRREAEQRGKAEKARDRTRQALDAMTSSVTGDSLSTQKSVSDEQKRFLTEVLTYYQEFAGEKADDESSRIRTAAAALRVGAIETRLGRTAEAATAWRLAIDGYTKLASDLPAVAAHRLDLAGSYNNLGNLLETLGRGAESEGQYRQALSIMEKLAVDFPDMPEYRFVLSISRTNFGELLAKRGKTSEAEESYQKALVIQSKLTLHYPSQPNYSHGLGTSHLNLGNLVARLGNNPEAEMHYRQSQAIFEKLVAQFPASSDYRKLLAHSHFNQGDLLARLGKPSEAGEPYRRAEAIQFRLVADFPTVPDFRKDLAKNYSSIAAVQAALGNPREAEELYRKSLIIQEKLSAEFPTVPDFRNDLAASHNNLGSLLQEMKDVPGAAAQYRQALAIQEKLAADFPTVLFYQFGLGAMYFNFAQLVSSNNQPTVPLDWFDKSIRALNALYERDPGFLQARALLRNCHGDRANLYNRLGRFTDAVKDWTRAIDLSPAAEQPLYRTERVISQAKAGQLVEALTEVEELIKSPKWASGQWYNFACVYAIASNKEASKKQQYAGHAVECLEKAIRAGWKDGAQMAKDTDLDSLHGREDFEKLVDQLSKKSVAQPMLK